MRFSASAIGRSPLPPPKQPSCNGSTTSARKVEENNIKMQEVGVRVPQQSGGLQLAPVNQATISLTSSVTAPRGSRGSSRGSESSEEQQPSSFAGSGGGSGGEDECSPMDLSSNGNGSPAAAAAAVAMAAVFENHPLLNPKKFAEFVKAQHLAQQQRENETTPPSNNSLIGEQSRLPKKRPWPELEPQPQLLQQQQQEVMPPQQLDEDVQSCKKPLIPLELIRAKWEKKERSSPDSSNGSSCSGTTPHQQSHQVKKRRLDALLNKKFAVTEDVVAPQQQLQQKKPHEHESKSKAPHRRKQPHPTTPSPPTLLSIRPNSELFPNQTKFPPTPPPPPPPPPQEEEEEEALKGQILQLQLAQAALLSGAASGSGSDLFKSPLFSPSGAAAVGAAGAANPLLYYGYYAQMLQGLQAQQHKLVEKLVSKQQQQQQKSADDIVKNLLNRDGFKLPPSSPSPIKESRNFENCLLPFSLQQHQRSDSPRLQQLCRPPSSSPGCGGEEPRRRAPRALTGRYVKSGTGASRRTLDILRNKIVERMKLKELLGENSHLYFGALNKQKKGGKAAVRK